jgi:formamidopyrimidine-DNA glycosylase
LKKLFLDQRVVVGLGNIYADEVCFRAGVRPTRTVESLKLKDLKSLYTAITQILPEAVQDGGSSVANYLLADGQRGNFARKHFVYNRGGEDCKICASTLKKIKLAGRTTVYCPKCQK